MTVADLLSGPYLLNVPMYQRPYSWGRDQACQLLDDLLEASGIEGGPDEPDPSYFLGTILLMDTPGNVTGRITSRMPPREYDIVDGQQRIVTLLTFFAVLRDLETDPKSALSKRAQAMILAQMGSRFFRTERLRLHIANADRPVFERYILQRGGTLESPLGETRTASEASLLGVRDLFISRISDMTADERTRLANFIADQCDVVLIISHDIDRAHRLFVVLNERGKKLQRNDILKADVLSRLPQDRIAWAISAWDKASNQLGGDFENFFSHLRVIYGHSRPQVVSGVRAIVREQGGAEPFLTNAFLPLAASYAAIKTGRSALPDEIRRPLEHLRHLADGDWAPAAMLALRNWKGNPAGAAATLSEIDRLAHLLRLLSVGTGKRVRRFSAAIEAIKAEGALGAGHSSCEITRDEARNIAFHLRDLHRRGPKICKLLLLRLSSEMSGQLFDGDPEHYTIEHVLPQRPSATSEWMRWHPSAEIRNRCTESIGNLVLVPEKQNDKARNASFAEKKKIYAQTEAGEPLIAITAGVLGQEQWRQADIEERERRLLALIEKTWRIDLLGKGAKKP
jgi:hypothetical protein